MGIINGYFPLNQLTVGSNNAHYLRSRQKFCAQDLMTASVVLSALVLAASLGLVLPGAAVVAGVASPVERNAHLPVPAIKLCVTVTA
jgi:hypothetical protein